MDVLIRWLIEVIAIFFHFPILLKLYSLDRVFDTEIQKRSKNKTILKSDLFLNHANP